MNTAEKNLAIQQTAEMAWIEIRAQNPCSVGHIRGWLVDQCAFSYAYMWEALAYLEMKNDITIDEEGIIEMI
jgi:hypothetical protein